VAGPRQYKSAGQIYADLAAREPDATPERAGELAVLAQKQARAAVMFFDFTFSADKSMSVLHALASRGILPLRGPPSPVSRSDT
jgi:hypothetical protein